jgi:hypothetical protein
MSAASNYFFCSCAILLFAIINLSVGPIINNRVSGAIEWGLANCAKLVDDLDTYKSESHPTLKPEDIQKNIEEYEKEIRICKNKKAMYGMEYTSFIFNAAIGFICVLLGLYGLQKELLPITGLIGLGGGIAGFVLTLVYVIFNGIVYTNYYEKTIYKRDGDGAFAELDGSSYECYYYKEGDPEAIIAKYSDLIKSQYNYNKKLIDSFSEDPEKKGCKSYYYSNCADNEYIDFSIFGINLPNYTDESGALYLCIKLYLDPISKDDLSYYDQSARFLTVLIFSLLTILCYLGLAFSGFTLKKESS